MLPRVIWLQRRPLGNYKLKSFIFCEDLYFCEETVTAFRAGQEPEVRYAQKILAQMKSH